MNDEVDAAVSAALAGRRVILAVSGGADSLVMLHAAARVAPASIATVATFDHGTGEAATRAARLVVEMARALGVPVVAGRAGAHDAPVARTEAAWREARWRFLQEVSVAHDAPVATAHTADDQLETILLRYLRGSGARGLAALAAPSPVIRPLLALPRAAVHRYARAHALPFIDDPANADRRHARVRMRQLLPALDAHAPSFRPAMLALAERAAAWRTDVARWVDGLGARADADGTWWIDRAALGALPPDAQALVWPELVARLGVPLSADGTSRCVRFTSGTRPGAELRLPGGVRVVRLPAAFRLVRAPAGEGRGEAVSSSRPMFVTDRDAATAAVTLAPEPPADRRDPWWCPFPAGAALVIRTWRPGDRIVTASAPAGRRIARYLAEAGVPTADRRRWPVVWMDGAPAWVPGVCRGVAASSRSDRSELLWYRSARNFARD